MVTLFFSSSSFTINVDITVFIKHILLYHHHKGKICLSRELISSTGGPEKCSSITMARTHLSCHQEGLPSDLVLTGLTNQQSIVCPRRSTTQEELRSALSQSPSPTLSRTPGRTQSRTPNRTQTGHQTGHHVGHRAGH